MINVYYSWRNGSWVGHPLIRVLRARFFVLFMVFDLIRSASLCKLIFALAIDRQRSGNPSGRRYVYTTAKVEYVKYVLWKICFLGNVRLETLIPEQGLPTDERCVLLLWEDATVVP